MSDAAPELSRDELVVGVMRLAALPGARDGHTAVYPFDQHARGLHVYPLRLYDFADGIHVVGSLGPEDLTGRRVTAIGNTPIDEVVELVRPLVPHDNESGFRWLLPEYLATAEVLRGLGIVAGDTATFSFADGSEAALEPVDAGEVASTLGGAPAPLPTDARPGLAPRASTTDQWLTTLEGGKVVYLGYRLTTGATYDTADRLFALARKPGVRRVIVDVRLNHGGDNTTYRPLLGVLAAPVVQRKLVVLTGSPDLLRGGQLRRRRRPCDERALRRRAGGRSAQPVGRLDRDHARTHRPDRPRRHRVLGVRAAGGQAAGDAGRRAGGADRRRFLRRARPGARAGARSSLRGIVRAGMASTMPAERDLRRVIGDGDTIPDGEVEGVGEQDLLALYRSMVLLRTYDERSVVYHSQGRIGTYAIFWGHEAIQAGAVHALEDEDWIFPSYRESAIGLLRGMPPATILSWWRGHPAGWWNPADYNLASICVPIATQVPHAAGLAWGKRLRGETACALTFFGDGATSEGAFHEGANFAAVMRAPLVLLCNNNQWAISTPLSAQTRAEALVDKAAGYGIPGARVDGGDVLAVYEAARDAVARARAGEGPTFIEAVTYRAAPHATADDPKAYIDPERVEEERANECVGRFAGYLRRQGILHDALDEQIKAEAADAMRAGIAAAEAEPPADIGLVFEHALADPPASFAHDLAELRRILGE